MPTHIASSFGEVCKSCISSGKVEQNDCISCLSNDLLTISNRHCSKCCSPLHQDCIGELCPQCADVQRLGGHRFKNELIAISYNRKYTDFSFALHAYKGSRIEKREWMVIPLRRLLTTFLNNHLSCISWRYGIIDAIVPVPGNAEKILSGQSYIGVPVKRCLIDHRIGPGFSHGGKREFQKERFTTDDDVSKLSTVLLFDDVYTTGATALSAGYALYRAGVRRIIPFVMARHLLYEQYDMVALNGFDINHCNNCHRKTTLKNNILKSQYEIDTYFRTYELYKQGMPIDQISKIRSFRGDVIEKHLIEIARQGFPLRWHEIICQEDEALIIEKANTLGTELLMPIKARLPERITYFQIKTAIVKNGMNLGVN